MFVNIAVLMTKLANHYITQQVTQSRDISHENFHFENFNYLNDKNESGFINAYNEW
jgi:hypothetical protein